MIDRYARPEMRDIWTAETRLKIWFDIEAHAADAMAELVPYPLRQIDKPPALNTMCRRDRANLNLLRQKRALLVV